MPVTRAVRFLAAIVALGACMDVEPDRTRSVVVRDSAGVSIVENHAPALAPRSWSVADRRVLCSSEGPGGDPRIHQVTDVVPVGPDSVAVAVHVSAEILICSAGAVVGSFGGEGDGPGEFRSISGLLRVGTDSLAVVERRRTTVLDYTDGRGRTLAPTDVMGGGTVREFQSGSGVLAAVGALRDALVPEAVRVADLYLLRSDGTVARTVPSVPWDRSLGITTVMLFLWEGGVPWAIGPRGYWRVSRDTSEVRFYDETGMALSTRTPSTRVPVTAELWERGAEHVRQTIEFDPPMPEEIIDQMVAAPDDFGGLFAPAASRILLDSEGRPWIRVPDDEPLIEPPRWRVFSPEGRWITDVELPRGFYVQTIQDDRIYGVTRSDLGLESVVSHRLVVDGG